MECRHPTWFYIVLTAAIVFAFGLAIDWHSERFNGKCEADAAFVSCLNYDTGVLSVRKIH